MFEMKTKITRESPRNRSRRTPNRQKPIRAKLRRQSTNEGINVSRQSDYLVEQPHQANPNSENIGESYNTPLEFMKYRIFDTLKYIKP